MGLSSWLVVAAVTVGVLVPLHFLFGDQARQRRRHRGAEREQRERRTHDAIETPTTGSA